MLKTKYTRKPNINEVNEELRRLALKESEYNPVPIVNELLEKTHLIHAAWLFLGKVPNLLATLCTFLSSKPIHAEGSWYRFGIVLDFNIYWLNAIQNNDSIKDKPEYLLLAYAQRLDATLSFIIKALDEVKRYDAINSLKPLIEELVSFIVSAEGKKYWSKDTLDCLANNRLLNNCDSINSDQSILIHPAGLRDIIRSRLPLSILQIEDNETKIITNGNIINTNVALEYHQQSVNINHGRSNRNNSTKQQPQKKFLKKILLTFTDDGVDAAVSIASKLRSLGYGVAYLDENYNAIMNSPESTISRLFNKGVHFVIPILTQGYFKKVLGDDEQGLNINHRETLDQQYAKFIYVLMLLEFKQKQCMNYRFHCIIPQNVEWSNIKENLNENILFRSWFWENDLESFCSKIL